MYCMIDLNGDLGISSSSLVWALNTWLDAESQALPVLCASDLVCLKDGHYDVNEPEGNEEDQRHESAIS